jgi:glycosyltransferase involved in cell wall biosynthesis
MYKSEPSPAPTGPGSQALPRLRVAFVCHTGFALRNLYRGLFVHLDAHGFDCEAVVGDAAYLEGDELGPVKVHVVPMLREPSPLKDLASVIRLIRFFARNRYDLVHVSTVKGALLGAIAARLTGQRRVLFVVRTRIYQNKTGFSRWVYQKVDWLVSSLSMKVAPISREVGECMAADGLCPPAKLVYFGEGSSNGVDVARFSRTPETIAAGQALRDTHGIPRDALVLLSLGRLSSEKGINFLPDILTRLDDTGREVRLLLVGPVDWRNPADPKTIEALAENPKVIRLGYQPDPTPLYAAADLLIFPSRREGFGNVAIEAQAMGVPVIGFHTTGVREAVADGETGLLAPLDDGAALAELSARLATDDDLRATMAAAGVERVRAKFSNARIWGDLETTLRSMAGADRA